MSNLNPFDFNYKCRIPSNLNLDKILQENPISVDLHKNNPSKIRDRLAFIIGSLVNSYSNAIKNGKIKGEEEVTGLCTKYLQPVVRDYDKYIQYAIRVGIIEHETSYFNGKSCGKYRFCPIYQNSDKRVYVILDEGFVKLIYDKRKQSSAVKEYRKQFDHLCRLTVDWTVATGILDRLYGPDKESARAMQTERLKAIEDPRKATFKVKDTNRLYTTICNIHAKLRSALRYEGQPLVGIDIKSSIPFFSTALFNKRLLNGGIDYMLMEINPQFKGEDGLLKTCLILVDIVNSPSSKYPDIVKYKSDVINDDLYEKLKCEWNRRLGTRYDRKTAKRKLLEILNSPSTFSSDEKHVLKNLYGTFMQVVEEINIGFIKTKNGKGKGKRSPGDQVCTFAHVTQMFEALMLLDTVCKAIERQRPDIPFLTLHDCIFTTPEHVQVAQHYLVKEIKNVMGVAPDISIKYY